MGYPTDEFEEARGCAPPANRSDHTCSRTNSEHWDLRDAARCPQCRKNALAAGRTIEDIANETARVQKLMDAVLGKGSKELAIAVLKTLSDEERLEVFCAFCVHCGCIEPKRGWSCQCWNDE